MKKWKPPAENLPNIIEKLVEGTFMPQFFQLINITQYGDMLRETPATLFVPVEETLDIVPPQVIATVEKALKDSSLATEIVGNHIIEEPITLGEMLQIKELKTIGGKTISIDVRCNIREDFEFSISNACTVFAEISGIPMETANIVCYNGFIHTIRGIIV
ncbi:MAG: hypothetical protein GXN94_03435 [Aquificae bacterium]|nr:hypothetical protein [Aquificota bacterium]